MEQDPGEALAPLLNDPVQLFLIISLIHRRQYTIPYPKKLP